MTPEGLLLNAKVLGKIPLMAFVTSGNRIPIFHDDLSGFFLYDISKLEPEKKQALLLWIVTINKERIEEGESVVITRSMLAGNPLIK